MERLSMQGISNILDEIPQVVDAADAVELPHFSQEIRFENVTFSYA
jgi:ATP-binding cassette subfamily B protein